MAIRWAVSNGNWSNVATWDGGVALPGDGDTVYADGKNVIIDQDIIVGSINTSLRTGGVTGGQFLLQASNIMINCVITGSLNPLVPTLFCTHTSTNFIIGSIYGSEVNSQGGCINTTNGILNVLGDVYASRNNTAIISSNTSSLIVIGNVYGNPNVTANGVNGGIAILNKDNATTSITGNVYGGFGYSSGIGLKNQANTTCLITGNVYGGSTTPLGSSYGVFVSQGRVDITGNLIGGSNVVTNYAVYNSGNLNTTGNCVATTMPAVWSIDTYSNLYVGGDIENTDWIQAVVATKLKISTSLPQKYRFQDTSLVNRFLMTSNASPFLPAISDVRKDIIFGVNNDLVGTLAVPPKASVVSGVPTDDGVGTWAFANELITRLQNCATVESVGEQLEALIN